MPLKGILSPLIYEPICDETGVIRACHKFGLRITTARFGLNGKGTMSTTMRKQESEAHLASSVKAAQKAALEEAKIRRRAKDANASAKSTPTEKSGPKGAEPTRYGDWERSGIVYDF